ncbi:NADH-quinone oxidoreductase subunit NuoN [Cytobacillus depressus]|uniref:NADH-quinone oxidoreductase subunit N n=1 Tax=Cytobacillus depressus TaxID=1602942 RepID=A0A6L3V760_9BACI|nr:NADH-quinone oxidoreductase subunit NuoN [Cytobacillus depressus]KAB2336530.1 NADH-quinone oxidoreductase subunit NuoN [Cytobacillus depressus]
MDLAELLSYKWSIMTPEFIILGVATLLSLLDLFMPKTVNRKLLGWLGFAGVLAALASLISLLGQGAESILYDTFRFDAFAKAFKLLLLMGAALVMLLATSYESKDGLQEYRGEFFYLFLAALLGAMMMSSSGDLITLFVGLELLSISSYILAGIRKQNIQSNESAMKYVINGGISTAITLFGMSYVYGLTGTTNLLEMARGLVSLTEPQHIYLMGLALFMVFVGLSFKLATAPFHMWAPDVYQGAPTPVTAFLSVVSKTAGFIILVRIMMVVFLSTPSSYMPNSMPLLIKVQDYIAVLAAVTMIVGNVVALRQKNIKRLFAYSSIAQAGYLLVVIASLSVFIFDTLWFYLGAYLFMNLGAFAIIQLITQKTGSEDVSEFAGLYRKAPILAVAMAIFILSLAGIPGTAGFIGKLNIFMGALAIEPARYVLVSIMIATTVVSYFYYFGVLVQMFFRPAAEEGKIKLPAALGIVIGVCVFATVLFGVAPGIAFDFLHGSFNQFNDFFQ